jgi:predicted nucleotide-binding protein
MKRKLGGRNVFVIHGHDDEARQELVKIIAEAKFNPIVLQDMPLTGSATIMEKFEAAAWRCNYAIALLSPDDKTFDKLKTKGDERFRARQNVLIELGWFMAHIGRDKVYIVVKGNVEIPSDIIGVEVIRCKSKIREKAEKIKNMLLSSIELRDR